MKVITVIPAYNEERTIASVVSEAKNHCDGVIVVDDGSSDNTPKIIQALGIKYALCGHNRGAGSATRIGLKMALEAGADIVVTLDGDGQHDAREIPTLLVPFNLYGNVGVVIGSRFLNGYEIPKYRKFGIDVITGLYNLGHRHKVTDSQCCFRAYSRAFLKRINIDEPGFGFSVELLVKARKLGFGISEVPVSCIYHDNYKQDSTLPPLRHGLGVALKTEEWRLRLRS